MERALRQELQRADRQHGDDVAVPEIAFASRRCNKTGHNQQ